MRPESFARRAGRKGEWVLRKEDITVSRCYISLKRTSTTQTHTHTGKKRKRRYKTVRPLNRPHLPCTRSERDPRRRYGGNGLSPQLPTNNRCSRWTHVFVCLPVWIVWRKSSDGRDGPEGFVRADSGDAEIRLEFRKFSSVVAMVELKCARLIWKFMKVSYIKWNSNEFGLSDGRLGFSVFLKSC